MAHNQSTDDQRPIAGQAPERLVYLIQQPEPERIDNTIAIGPVLRVIWDGRWLALLIITAFSAVGVAYALLATPWYRAEVSLLPRDSSSGSALSAQLGQFGGLASLAGINLGAAGKEEPVAVLRSRGFVRQFIERNGLLTVVLADKWDADKKTWKGDAKAQPDVRDAVKFFEENIRRVTADTKSGLLIVAI